MRFGDEDWELTSKLHDFARDGDLENVLKILEAKPHLLTAVHRSGDRTALHWAARFGHSHVVETLFRLGASNLDSYPRSWTPMLTAAEYGRDSVIELLVRLGSKAIDTPTRTDSGWTPIHLAADRQKPETVKLLKALGANSNPPLAGRFQVRARKLLLLEVSEDEVLEIRHRVYFSRSLTQLLTDELQPAHVGRAVPQVRLATESEDSTIL